MRHEAAGVTEILLDSAKNEFLEYGFHDASLRRVAAKSGVSTNSIYTRFHDKTGLFGAVVKEAADGLMEIYLNSISEAKETFDVKQAMQIGGEGTDIVLKYIYKYKDEFKLYSVVLWELNMKIILINLRLLKKIIIDSLQNNFQTESIV